MSPAFARALDEATAALLDGLAAHGHHPVVARALDRLRDELTVVALGASGLGHRTPEEVRVRGADRRRAMIALGFGPMSLRELVDEVYPTRAPDPEEAHLRRHRVRRMLGRLIETGEVARVGKGVYQLRGWGPQERHPTIEDCRRLLASTSTQAVGGLGAREIARRLDAPIGTVRSWLARLRDRGVALRVSGRRGVADGVRYHLTPTEEAA